MRRAARASTQRTVAGAKSDRRRGPRPGPGPRIRPQVASGPTSMLMAQEFLDRMAVVRGSDEPDWETALGQLLAQLRRDSRIIVVTTSTKRMERLRTQAVQSAGDRRVQALIRDALWLDVSSPEFARYFQVD